MPQNRPASQSLEITYLINNGIKDQSITLTLKDTKVTAENDPTVCDLSTTITTDVVQRKSQLLKTHIPPFKILGTKSPYKMGSSEKGRGVLSR